jgi:pimeloyl-ACP methyl ester carboxylesterase
MQDTGMPPAARLAIGFLAAIALLYAFACVMLYLTQRNMVFFPVPRTNTADPLLVLKTDVGDVLVTTRAIPGRRALLYFGGNAEDVSQTVPELAVAFPDRTIHALHYRGYGGSAGTPSESAIVADALALFDLARATHDDIVVVGRSLGSGVAVQVAGARPATRLVLVTPYDSLANVAAAHYPAFPVRWLMRDPFDSVAIAPRLAMPTTIIAAGRDEVIPMANTRRLQAAFKPGVARFVLLPDEGHNFALTPEYLAALQSAP